jgi:hypothetical protein
MVLIDALAESAFLSEKEVGEAGEYLASDFDLIGGGEGANGALGAIGECREGDVIGVAACETGECDGFVPCSG